MEIFLTAYLIGYLTILFIALMHKITFSLCFESKIALAIIMLAYPVVIFTPLLVKIFAKKEAVKTQAVKTQADKERSNIHEKLEALRNNRPGSNPKFDEAKTVAIESIKKSTAFLLMAENGGKNGADSKIIGNLSPFEVYAWSIILLEAGKEKLKK